MKAMILAAGRGERLRPLTDTTPKPLLTIAGEPLIVHQLHRLAAAGLTDIVINLAHLGDRIERYLGDGRHLGVHLTYSRESERLETGGGIANALHLLGDAPFAVLNGDIWTDYPFERLPRRLAGQDLVHLVLAPTPPERSEGDFNLIEALGPPRADHSHHGRVVRSAHRPFVQSGISVLSPMLFAGIDRSNLQPFSLRNLWFEAADDDRVSGELWHGVWADIGSPEQLEAVRAKAGGA